MRNLGLLVARCAVGGTVAAHGYQKLFGAFDGGGIEGTAEAFSKMGFDPPRQHAMASGVAEGVGGTMLVMGAFTPAAAAAVAGNLAVAVSIHRPNGFFASDGGFELPGALSAVAAAIALTGPGSISFDRLFRYRFAKGWMGVVALAGAGAVAANLVQRREQRLASQSADEQAKGRRAEPPLAEPGQTETSSSDGEKAERTVGTAEAEQSGRRESSEAA
jgi:putative oxidoreductase